MRYTAPVCFTRMSHRLIASRRQPIICWSTDKPDCSLPCRTIDLRYVLLASCRRESPPAPRARPGRAPAAFARAPANLPKVCRILCQGKRRLSLIRCPLWHLRRGVRVLLGPLLNSSHARHLRLTPSSASSRDWRFDTGCTFPARSRRLRGALLNACH